MIKKLALGQLWFISQNHLGTWVEYSKRSGFDNIQIDGNYQKGVKFTMYTSIVNILC